MVIFLIYIYYDYIFSLDLVRDIFDNLFVYVLEKEVVWLFFLDDNLFGLGCYDDIINVIVRLVENFFKLK